MLYKKIIVETEQQNLTKLDPRLEEFLQPSDFFCLHNLTHVLHTFATITVNELDEPIIG